MNTQTIFCRDKTAPDHHPSVIFLSYKNMVTDKDNIFAPLMPAILKDYPRLFVYLLVQEIRNPLGHINLSVQMLESLIEDNDLKMYLDIITRNSIRMNNLINNFITDSRRMSTGKSSQPPTA
jgi:nitrogen-specific signal transduction histidine kinase